MKLKLINTLSLLLLVAAIGLTSCDTGKSDTDGNKDIEGKADPANTGGALGGSQSEAERAKNIDTVKTSTDDDHK
ncbi:MAG: hypothetical protein K0S44_659 [Bacteroidetes bacterium]|jgi:hypothetical protein|nr:hypothetical protein [Bacteroidota bacterium]